MVRGSGESVEVTSRSGLSEATVGENGVRPIQRRRLINAIRVQP